MDKKSLTETEIRTRYITPAILNAGWNPESVREEYFYFTNGKIEVNGKDTWRRKAKKVDYLLYGTDHNNPLAVVEAKDNNSNEGDGMQQAIDYAEALDVKFVFTSNGDSFVFHDKTASDGTVEKTIRLEEFPTPEELEKSESNYSQTTSSSAKQLLNSKYHDDGSGKKPRYYQRVAINRTIKAIAKGQKRILLVMATGTGKTYTAAQIIWRFWKSGDPTNQKRILFLADRNILVDQTKSNDFQHFGNAMTKITNRKIDKAYEIYLTLYQAITGPEESSKVFKKFDRDFFDMIVIDECHRGSAKEDSAWREILSYFSSAVQIGLTATPVETTEASSSDYFGEALYTYSLATGIDDGFLAPYKVIRIATDVDTFGWRPDQHAIDDKGNLIEDREYSTKDFDRNLILPQRDNKIAEYITAFLAKSSPYDKTIVFCKSIDHATRMRQALINHNSEHVQKNSKYIMKIVGDDEQGKAQLDNFIDPESRYPVIATTSKLMTTGVDAQTCKVIVLDSNIESMTEFKQIIGRGTRVNEPYGKMYFTILDFRNVTKLFADPDFDGDPVKVYEPKSDKDFEDVLDDIIDPKQPDLVNDGESEDGSTRVEDEPPAVYKPTRETSDRIIHTVSSAHVTIVGERVQILDGDGNLTTKSLKDYTREGILEKYATMENFLQEWTHAKRRYKLIEELEQHGIPLQELYEKVSNDIDMFDMILDVAYNQKPISKSQRKKAVLESNFLHNYPEQVQAVLQALLNKYADSNIKTLEDASLLKIDPLTKFGTPLQIAELFGGAESYQETIGKLEDKLYEGAVA